MYYNFVIWKWKQKDFRCDYTSGHANIVASMIKRHTKGLMTRVICVTDDAAGLDPKLIDAHPLWPDHNELPNASGIALPSCYRRLKLFDPVTQKEMGITEGQRIISIDLDTCIVQDIRPLLERREPFVGWAVRGTHHITVFNGSQWMFYAGPELAYMWTAFRAEKSPQVARKAGFLGSDQAWLSYNLARWSQSGGWKWPDVASYPRELVRRPVLPKHTRIVNFHGKRKPWHEDVQREAPWIKEHWLT